MPIMRFLAFVWIFFIMCYDYTSTVRYRTLPVLKANTFFKNLSDLFSGYSVDINSGTFIAEMMTWQEKFVMTIRNTKRCWKEEK
jgi:hypothetical protein